SHLSPLLVRTRFDLSRSFQRVARTRVARCGHIRPPFGGVAGLTSPLRLPNRCGRQRRGNRLPLVALRLLGGGPGGEGMPQGGAGGDAQFGEGLVEVGGDGARGEDEALGDLFVGEPRGGQLGDLLLLGCERRRPRGSECESGGAEFVVSPGSPWAGVEALER